MNRIDTSWMYGAINRYQNDAERLRNRTARLSADIDRLEAARDAVDSIYQDDKSFVSWVDSYDVGGSWQGSRREEFEEAKRSAKASGEEYCRGVAEIRQAICDKITQLENERADGLGALSFVYQCLNDVQNTLTSALWNMQNN